MWRDRTWSFSSLFHSGLLHTHHSPLVQFCWGWKAALPCWLSEANGRAFKIQPIWSSTGTSLLWMLIFGMWALMSMSCWIVWWGDVVVCSWCGWGPSGAKEMVLEAKHKSVIMSWSVAFTSVHSQNNWMIVTHQPYNAFLMLKQYDRQHQQLLTHLYTQFSQLSHSFAPPPTCFPCKTTRNPTWTNWPLQSP